MTNLEKLREKIIKEIPEIVELKFGCEVSVLFDDSDYYGKVKPYWVIRSIYSVSAKKTVVYIVDPPFPNNAINIQERIDKKELKIIGRKITLADVLLVLKNKRSHEFYTSDLNTTINVERRQNYELNRITLELWNLENDDLNLQSPETIDFLTQLLI